MSTIKIYGKSSCPWCDKAKDLATQYGFDYTYIDIGLKENYDELKELVPDLKTVPQIFWNEKYLGGYDGLSREIENTAGGYGDQLF